MPDLHMVHLSAIALIGLVTLTFDRLITVFTVMGFHPASFGLPSLSVLELGRGMRQTDRQTDRETPPITL